MKMTKGINLVYPFKVWITTVLFSSLLVFLDLNYLSSSRVKLFIIEDIYIGFLILFGLLTYSLPLFLILFGLLLGFKNIIKDGLKLKIFLIAIGASATITMFHIVGYGINMISVLCVVFEILVGIIFSIHKSIDSNAEFAK